MKHKWIHIPWATLFNGLTVLIGSLIGMMLQNNIAPEVQSIIFQAIGLGVLILGIKMGVSLPDGYWLVLIFGMITGGLIGEILSLDQWFTSLSDNLQSRLQVGDENFTEGLITSFLIFCVGAMTIVGSLEEGLKGKRTLIMIKAILDGFASIALASTYGIGVLFSVIPLLVFQGGISLFAYYLKPIMKEDMLLLFSSTGGVLLIGISTNMLNMTQINVLNLLPVFITIPVFAMLKKQFSIEGWLKRYFS